MSFAAVTLCVASQQVFVVAVLFHYQLSPETFGYTLVYLASFIFTSRPTSYKPLKEFLSLSL